MPEVSHGFKGEAGKRSKRATKSNDDEQTPARIEQHSLAGPDHEETDNKAARYIDKQRSIGKNRPERSSQKAADEPACVRAYDGAARDGKEFADG